VRSLRGNNQAPGHDAHPDAGLRRESGLLQPQAAQSNPGNLGSRLRVKRHVCVPDLSSAREVMDGEGNTKVVYDRHIIAPGKINIGASLVYDTVSTGVGSFSNMAIPSQVQQTLHLTAANEYRDLFPLTSALNSGGAGNGAVVEWALPGAHTNLGGGSYDRNGIGAANLEIGYTYLQRAGVPLAPLPDNWRPNPSQFVIYDSRWVHDVPFGQLVNDPNAHRVIKYGK